ncbi:MAG: 4Fe-4S dicluster domain-containing protein [Nitrospiraceae bacterium]|nr:4Fe-4S dicluster domain-containing protein [Nitrospiraceae bacterium]
MARQALLVSPELCIGCRGCQTACKEWNHLSVQKTRNTGTFENPPDLSRTAYNRIRFIEMPTEGGPRWMFVSQRCMHCGDAPCMTICPSAGAIFRTKEGAVAFNRDKCIGCRLCSSACPFGLVRFDEKNRISKCHMCSDRIASGLSPACAKTCPTGALKFGDRNSMISLARTAGYNKLYGEEDLAGLSVLYAFKESPKVYGLKENPAMPETLVFWNEILKPLAYAGFGLAVGASLLHYLAIGPKREEEETRHE